MTPEQFIYWLDGYLAASTVPHDHKVAIAAKIRDVQNPPAPVIKTHISNGIGIRDGLARGGFVAGGGDGIMPFGGGIALATQAVGKPLVSVAP